MVRRLLLLNGLAAVLAVSHHTVNWALTAMFWWTDRYTNGSVTPNYAELGSAEFYGIRLIDQLVCFGVPAFLFVSGYFVSAAAGHSARIGWNMVGNRIKGLLFPYLLWSFVAMLMNAFNGTSYSISRVLWELLTGGAAAPFYYVPLLIQLYVLSPWLVSAARDRWKLLLVVTGSVQLGVAMVRSSLLVSTGTFGHGSSLLRLLLNSHLGAYSFWFASGLVVGLHVAGFKTMLLRIRRMLPWVLAIVYVAAFVEWEWLRRLSGRPWISTGVTVSDNMLALVLLLTFFAFDKITPPSAARLSQIGTMSYGIYLMHIPVLEVVARSIYHGAPGLLSYQILLQFLLLFAGVGFPMLLMTLIKASPFRRYYSYAFG